MKTKNSTSSIKKIMYQVQFFASTKDYDKGITAAIEGNFTNKKEAVGNAKIYVDANEFPIALVVSSNNKFSKLFI